MNTHQMNKLETKLKEARDITGNIYQVERAINYVLENMGAQTIVIAIGSYHIKVKPTSHNLKEFLDHVLTDLRNEFELL